MKITHLNNSFMMIEAGGTRLLCDPWAGVANEGGWHSFPEYDPDALYAFMRTADAVYISHIHADHFDPALLRASGVLDKPFIIKDFISKTLKNRLLRLGAARVIELAGQTRFDFNGLSLSIVPQMTSNSGGLEDQIDYDLDTSIIVHGDGLTLFNQVDNPLSLDNYRTVRDYIDHTYGTLDVACLMTGAASGYPQHFVNLDRPSEQAAVIARSLDKFSSIIDVLQPRVYIPAGGTYILPGRFAPLNRWVAQPDFQALRQRLKERAQAFDIEGGFCLNLSDLTLSQPLSPLPRSKAEAVTAHASDTYPHDDFDDSDVDADALDALFAEAYARYSAGMSQGGVVIGQTVTFILHERLSVDADGLPSDDIIGRFTLRDHRAEGHALDIHLDRKLFIKGLSGRSNWNQLLSLALFERTPNLHMPTVDFSLNYLVCAPPPTG